MNTSNDPPHTYRRGDAVVITFDGSTATGRVVIASPNGRSLMLAFDAMLGGYVGTMPVLFARGEFRDLMNSNPVTLKPAH